jgi:hypothetical protein
MHPSRPSCYFYIRSKYPLSTVQSHVILLCKESIQVFPISSQILKPRCKETFPVALTCIIALFELEMVTYSCLECTQYSSDFCILKEITYRIHKSWWNVQNKQESRSTLYRMRNCCFLLSNTANTMHCGTVTRWILKGYMIDGLMSSATANERYFITFRGEKNNKLRQIVTSWNVQKSMLLKRTCWSQQRVLSRNQRLILRCTDFQFCILPFTRFVVFLLPHSIFVNNLQHFWF